MSRLVGCILFALCLFSQNAFACPAIKGLPDRNCDGKIQIAVIGDSLVYGFGDTQNGNKGGYVRRVAKMLTKFTFVNLGRRGMFSWDLLTILDSAFKKGTEPQVKNAIQNADIVIIDLGRNDRWSFGTPLKTYVNLRAARTKIKNRVKALQGDEPVVVIAVMMLPNRGSQGPWMKALDAMILKNSTRKDPADLRFDLVSKWLLSSDQIHPTSVGYQKLAETLANYLTKVLPKKKLT